jgi:nucleotide-binding universal stress UspA family protein
MEVSRVLWPTDFSSSAEKALPYVTDLTQKYGAEIHVLYVIEDIAHHDSWYGDFDKTHVDKLMEWADKSAKKRLDQVCEKYLDSCPLYIKHIAVGDPAREILKLIDKEKVDLVVMASHGRRGDFRFGSVTEKVLKNSPVPVTTIPIEPE